MMIMIMTLEERILLIIAKATMQTFEEKIMCRLLEHPRMMPPRNIERSTLTASIALLVDSHGFLEYVDAVLLDERSSLNNQ